MNPRTSFLKKFPSPKRNIGGNWKCAPRKGKTQWEEIFKEPQTLGKKGMKEFKSQKVKKLKGDFGPFGLKQI